MKVRRWFKASFGAGAVALAIVAGLAFTSPAAANVVAVAPRIGAQHWGSPGLGRGGVSLTTIAGALGMTEAELRTELQSGKSVADVAGAKGVSLDTVIAAIVDEQAKQLSAAVAAGRITQAQADAALANLKENLPELLALKGGPFGPGFGRWPGRMPGWWPGITPQPPNTDTNL